MRELNDFRSRRSVLSHRVLFLVLVVLNTLSLKGNTTIYDYFPTLHRAVGHNSIERVKLLIQYGADVNEEFNGVAPLILAIENNNIEMIQLLLEKGAKAHVVVQQARPNFFPGQTTPLMMALIGYFGADRTWWYEYWPRLSAEQYARIFELCTLLIEKGSDVNARDERGMTALHYAASIGDLKIFKYLLEKGARIDAKDNMERTALSYAAEKGRLDVIQFLFEKNPRENEIKDAMERACEKGRTKVIHFLMKKGVNLPTEHLKQALISAVERESLEDVKFLIQKGAELDTQKDKLLIYASREGNIDVVKYLVEKGANLKGENGAEAVLQAISERHPEVVRFLVEKGAKLVEKHVRIIDGTGVKIDEKGVLTAAAQSGNLECLKVIMNKRTNIPQEELNESFVYAAGGGGGNIEMLKFLLQKGADINFRRRFGDTAFSMAFYAGRMDIVSFLLLQKGFKAEQESETMMREAAIFGNKEAEQILKKNGTSLTTKDMESVFSDVIKNGDMNTVQFLVEKGVSVNAKGPFNEFAFLEAVKYGHLDIVKFLIERGKDVNEKYDGVCLGSRVNLKCHNNITAYEVAIKSRQKETAKFLSEMSANIPSK